MVNGKEEAIMAYCIHCALAHLHIIGVLYNLKNGNRLMARFHYLAFVLDVEAASRHAKDIA